MLISFGVFVPELFVGAEVDPAALNQAVGVAIWISWVVNLLVVEWWLDRHPAPYYRSDIGTKSRDRMPV